MPYKCYTLVDSCVLKFQTTENFNESIKQKK